LFLNKNINRTNLLHNNSSQILVIEENASQLGTRTASKEKKDVLGVLNTYSSEKKSIIDGVSHNSGITYETGALTQFNAATKWKTTDSKKVIK
jgi:hypothetical protein